MTWGLFLIGYFFVGSIFTMFAAIGHKSLYAVPMHWSMKMVGPVLWPFVLLFGGRK